VICINNYVVYHLHSDFSLLDSVTKSKQYIEKAKELKMTAIGEANHGNIYSWVNRKKETEKVGLKYIHAQEFYITESLNEKIRDNYHTVLISKNWNGVLELNKLSSLAYQRDGHFYYNPRLSIDELINTSDNILITSACLASPLYKGRDKEIYNKYLKFFINNKHRCFLEIQPHLSDQQKEYNLYLYELNKTYDLNLLAGTDTHSLDKEYASARSILQKAKNINYSDEDSYDLTFKSYNELVEYFKSQNCLPKKVYLKAIDMTNKIADMIEEFELDYSIKYPKLFNNPENVFKEKINEGIIKRGINKFDKEKRTEYYNRIKYEYDTYVKCNAIDYMLLQKDIIDFCHSNNIWQGYSRGSVSGSIIAYILGITESDSIKFNLIYDRFLNSERISQPDIDTDYPPSQRDIVKKYIFNKNNIYCADIITFNTLAIKGAIRDVARSLNISLIEVDEITKNIETNEEKYREEYPELFKYVDLLQGVNVSVGTHPCGLITSPIYINDNIGLCTLPTSEYPVSQINMKEIDGLNFVKLDILSLDNIEIINKTCEYANIERLTPDNTDQNDKNVWNSILESSLGVFQWEGSYAHDIYRKLFNSETMQIIKLQTPNITYMDLFSMGNGALRPAGESYRNEMCKGIFNDNGHEALNNFLSSTMGYLIYQEQIIEFLNKFCGFTLGEADIVRRGFAKKIGTEEYIPRIKNSFIKTMREIYNTSEEESEKIIESFLIVIYDASNYLFSINHSYIYSWIGYICAYLRYYYPLEFITVMLNINKDNIEKTAEIIKYADTRNIKIKPIKFRKSQAHYSMEKETNSIHKGISSIKFSNSQIADELYELGKNKYNHFLDLLIDISKTSINSRQLEILTILNFFSEFGKNKKLLKYNELYYTYYNKKTIKKETMDEEYKDTILKYVRTTNEKGKEYKQYQDFQSYDFLKEIWDTIPNESIDVLSQIKNEKEYLGYIETKIENIIHDVGIVLSVDTKYAPKIKIYHLNSGIEKQHKIYKKYYNDKSINRKLEEYDIISIEETTLRPKYKYNNGNYEETDEKESYITKYYKVSLETLNKHLKEIEEKEVY